MTTVSCGGNILINVGPSRAGIIEPVFVERLQDMGNWLKINGEAIYDTIPWKHQNDTVMPGVWYTSSKQATNKRMIVYAIILNYPFDTAGVNLHALAGVFDNSTKVSMLGIPDSLNVSLLGIFEIQFQFKSIVFISFSFRYIFAVVWIS